MSKQKKLEIKTGHEDMIEELVVIFTKALHPFDLGTPTFNLETTLREMITDIVNKHI